jgi:hypothetical protein
MNIEKTFKLTIKDTTFNLTEEEVSALYEACRRALNISITGTKPFDNPITPTYPTWPVYPGTGTNPIWFNPIVTSNGANSIDNSVMDSNFTINNSGISPFTNAIPSRDLKFVDPTPNKVGEWAYRKAINTSTITSEGIKVG